MKRKKQTGQLENKLMKKKKNKNHTKYREEILTDNNNCK